jgi:ubiquinone/menaquinone biosynthesis C-methylase UbiE
MRPIVDPEGLEVRHFIDNCHPEGKRILEVGCGRGTLTYQYSRLSRSVLGFDPALSELRIALEHKLLPGENPVFVCAKAERMPFPAKYFDTVVFASSL